MEKKYSKEITEINELMEQLKSKAFELHAKLAAETEVVMPKYTEWKTIRKELEEENNYGKEFEAADDECMKYWKIINNIDDVDINYGIELVSAIEDIEFNIQENQDRKQSSNF